MKKLILFAIVIIVTMFNNRLLAQTELEVLPENIFLCKIVNGTEVKINPLKYNIDNFIAKFGKPNIIGNDPRDPNFDPIRDYTMYIYKNAYFTKYLDYIYNKEQYNYFEGFEIEPGSDFYIILNGMTIKIGMNIDFLKTSFPESYNNSINNKDYPKITINPSIKGYHDYKSGNYYDFFIIADKNNHLIKKIEILSHQE